MVASRNSNTKTPQTSNNWPCDWMVVSAKARRTGNSSGSKSNGKSVGISGIRVIKTSSRFYFPLIVLAPMTLLETFFTASRVPMFGQGWLKLYNIFVFCRQYGSLAQSIMLWSSEQLSKKYGEWASPSIKNEISEEIRI